MESWLAKVELSMVKTLKRMAKAAMESSITKKLSQWMAECPVQIALVVVQQQWAAKIEQIFDTNDQQKIAMLKLLRSSMTAELENLQVKLRLLNNPFDRQTWENVIKLLIYQRDTTNALIEMNVMDE